MNDLEFARNVAAYLDWLQVNGSLARYRLTRRKLGLSSDAAREFHVELEFESLADLDAAFAHAASRSGEVERLHAKVYSAACNLRFDLFRDFPANERG